MNSIYRPKKCNKIVFRADDDFVGKLKFLAEYYGVSKTAVITELVEDRFLTLMLTIDKIF